MQQLTNLNQIIPLDPQQIQRHRPLAAWAMNDKMENAELERQLRSFQQLGYGGVMVIPWGGLPNDFMDDAWLDSVEHILNTAGSLGMEVWLWDDWLFPSGFGAGKVTEEPDFRSKKLRYAIDVLLQPGEEFQAKVPPRALTAAVFTANKFGNPTGAFRALDLKAEVIKHRATERERLIIAVWDEMSSMTYTVRSHTAYLTDMPEAECDICINCDPEAFSVDLLNDDATHRFLELIHERYWARFPQHFGKTLKGFFYDEPNIPTTTPWSNKLPAAFAKQKGYELQPHVMEMLTDYRMNDITFLEMQPESAKQVKSDFTDVWTTMMAENFFGVIREWCHAHGVLSIGHLGSDDQMATMISASGMYFKNMAHADVPGVDIIFEQLAPGMFNDMPRMAGSRARMYGLPRALSESFAGMGHGMYPDLMRFVMEHQLIRGINKFFLKLLNYNPQKAWYFHPPELSEDNQLIARYGAALYGRITKLSALLSSGKPIERVALFVPAQNFYRMESAIAAKIDALARQLVYNQWEIDYVWDGDLQSMDLQDGKLVNKSGDTYGCVVIPPGAIIEEVTAQRLRELGNRVVAVKPLHASGVGQPTREPLALVQELMSATRTVVLTPANSPVSIATRKLDSDYLHLLLNESVESQTVQLIAARPGSLLEVEVESGALFGVAETMTLRPGESKLILLSSEELNAQPSRALPTNVALELTRWTVTLPDGGMRELNDSLPTWDALGLPDYHGTVRYKTEFYWPGGPAVLSLGTVSYAATVHIDGQPIDAIFAPFQVELPALAAGAHKLEIEVMNTPASELYGSEERFEELKSRGAFKGTYDIVYEPIDRKRLRSGLLGPVRVYKR